MMTSCTSLAGIPDLTSAALMAVAPSSGADTVARAPRNLPIGVRAAATMTGMRELSAMRESYRSAPDGTTTPSEASLPRARHGVSTFAPI